MRLLARLALAVAAVAVVSTAIVVIASAQPKEQERTGDDRFQVRITDEMIRHSRLRDTLYFVSLGWSAGALLLLLYSGASRRMRDAAARVKEQPFVMGVLYLVMFICAMAVIEFPLTYYSGFVVPHQFDLSDQPFGSWMGDMLKGMAVNLVILSVLGSLALLAIRSFKQWWAALWAVSIPLIILMIVIQPIVLDPIFNKFEPLQDAALRQKLLDLASRAGIEGSRVYQVNKSKQTKTLNAYVNGIGPTKRIVMWDTLLAKMDHDEVLAVMGHEMGHYVLKHIWKGLAFGLGVSFVALFLLQRIHDRVAPRFQFAGRGDPASVPLLLLIVGGLSFFLSPINTAYSRHVEHQADIFSLELTRLNEPFASAFVKMAEDSKRDPSPHPFMKYWLYTHPPIAERIPFALGYRPWENQPR
jgi:Zn-dependent protease with chaperone function